MQLSPHFTLAETACRCGCRGEEAPAILANLKSLCYALEKLRDVGGGRPVTINDAYRCGPHNAAVGGEPQSQHLRGKAADLTIEGLLPSQVQALATRVQEIGGIGHYQTFTHVDIRARIEGHQTTWHG